MTHFDMIAVLNNLLNESSILLIELYDISYYIFNQIVAIKLFKNSK